MNKRNIRIGILLLLFAATIFYRAYGLDSHSVADEFYEVRRALNVLEGEFNWAKVFKGGLYILLVPIYFVTNFFNQDYHSFLLIGRIVQVVIGIVLIACFFCILRILYRDIWAFFFIIPIIFHTGLIYNAHHVNVQNLMFVGVMFHLYFIIKYFKTNDYKLFCMSLIPLSFAIASQISAVIFTIPFFLFSLILVISTNQCERIDVIKGLLKYGFISLGIYILLTPGIVVYFKKALSDMTGLSGLSEDGSPFSTVYQINPWTEYAKYIINFFGKPNLVLVVISVIVVFIKRKWFFLYPLSIFLLFYFIFSNASQTAYSGRYIIPGLLQGFIIMPLAVVEWSDWLARYKNKNLRYFLLTIPIILIGLNFCRIIFYSWENVKEYAFPDTRRLVSEWLKANTTIDDRILLGNTSDAPDVPFKEQAVRIDIWKTYPDLDSIDVNYVIINKSTVDYFISKKIEVMYDDFFIDLANSEEWELVHTEKSIPDKSTGPGN